MNYNPIQAWAARSAMWPAERIERMRALAGEGLSASAIGARLGTSKNSIVGKCRRLGVALLCPNNMDKRRPRDRSAVCPVVVRHVPITDGITLPPLASERAARKAPAKPKAPEVPTQPPLPRYGAGSTCQWPMTADRPWKFCGNSCAIGRPFCAAHAKLAYQRRPNWLAVEVAA